MLTCHRVNAGRMKAKNEKFMKHKIVRQWLITYFNGGMNLDQIEEKIFHLFDENQEGVSSDSSKSLAFHTVLGNRTQAVVTDEAPESLVGGTLGKRTDTKEDDRRICRHFPDKDCICMGIYCGYK